MLNTFLDMQATKVIWLHTIKQMAVFTCAVMQSKNNLKGSEMVEFACEYDSGAELCVDDSFDGDGQLTINPYTGACLSKDGVTKLRDHLNTVLGETPPITMGVGDGTGNLFVHGDYESIKVLQGKLIELEDLRVELDRLKKAINHKYANVSSHV